MKEIEIRVPDLGSDDGATVVEILAKEGQMLTAGDSLVVVETDKASSEIPSDVDGKLLKIAVTANTQVKTGALLAVVAVAESAAVAKEPSVSAAAKIEEIILPDLGSDAANVIEILVEEGEKVEEGQSLLTVETDKATSEVPSPLAGVVKELKVQLNSQVASGALLFLIETTVAEESASEVFPVKEEAKTTETVVVEKTEMPPSAEAPKTTEAVVVEKTETPPSAAIVDTQPSYEHQFHASPAVRRLARELGVGLALLKGTGANKRITLDDVKGYVKSLMQSAPNATGSPAPAALPLPDFSQFGEVEELAQTGIKKVSAQHLSRSWQTVPLVTHFEEADISELEQFRKQLNSRKADHFPKTTPLAFIIRAVVKTLKEFPLFNSSYDASAPKLWIKRYYHIGIAVATKRGLVVPVLRHADRLSLDQISQALLEISTRARAGKLSSADMQGGSFTISSLGGIGGSNFTPLVNAPEVAILGVARSSMKPIWQENEFVPRLILPFSLSYDHRVADGAEAAAFCSHLRKLLSDLRYILV